MKRILRAAVALGAAVTLLPVGAAHADPASCSGSPETPDAYICLARIEGDFGFDDTPVPVDLPSQEVGVDPTTVTVDGHTFTVPSQPVHIPQFCPVLTTCVGPFDTSTPGTTQSTPPVSQTIPGHTENTPPAHTDIPLVTPYVNATIVVWYKGTCYYVRTDGAIYQADSSSPATCP